MEVRNTAERQELQKRLRKTDAGHVEETADYRKTGKDNTKIGNSRGEFSLDQ